MFKKIKIIAIALSLGLSFSAWATPLFSESDGYYHENIDPYGVIAEVSLNRVGYCLEGVYQANPQGWIGGVPECGEVGKWLIGCVRKTKLRFLPKKVPIKEFVERRRICE